MQAMALQQQALAILGLGESGGGSESLRAASGAQDTRLRTTRPLQRARRCQV